MAASWSLWLLLLALARTAKEGQAQDCGMAPLNTKITGGTNANAGSWPWQVSLHQNTGGGTFAYVCGGTLISRQWVLTAANCIMSGQSYTVFLGRQTQQGPNPNEVQLSVSSILLHPDFNVSNFMDNDAALLRLSSPVTITDFTRPICLAAGGSAFPPGMVCYMTGWGKLTLTDSAASNELQQVLLPMVAQQQCQNQFSGVSINITSGMICAGALGRGICTGDSGGPLQCRQDSMWVQAGIASFGDLCAKGTADVYTRVSALQSWITENVGAQELGFVTFSSAQNNPTSGAGELTILYMPLLSLLTLLS